VTAASGIAVAVAAAGAAVAQVAVPASARPAPAAVVPAPCAVRQIGNPGFESGSAAPWSASASVIDSDNVHETSHSGTWFAWLDGYGTAHTDVLSQTIAIPSGCATETISFWLHVDTDETTKTVAFDELTVQLVPSAGGATTLATFSNLDHATGYTRYSFDVAAFAGTSATLKFTGTEDGAYPTSFVIDDVALNAK
jgi:hypothetical protein